MSRRATVGVVALATAAAVVSAPSSGAATSGVPSFSADSGGFHSVLAYGSGQTVNAADLAAYEATGQPPATFVNQTSLYNAVITRQPRNDADLVNYYKNSDFAVPTGSDVGSTETPTSGAVVIRDKTYSVPHIYGSTRAAAMYAVGYATAEDRLFLMDVIRRTAEGSTAELLGPTAVRDDSAALGQFDLSPAELEAEINRLPQEEGAEGRQALTDVQQYVAGINAYIDAARIDPSKMPAEYAALGTTPRAWTLADTAAEAYLLIAQFTVAGDGEQLQSDILARLQKRLGAKRGAQVYQDLRNFENSATPTTTSKSFPSDRTGRVDPRANARIDAGSITSRNAVVATQNPSPGAPTPLVSWARDLAAHGLQLPDEASNALLVEGRYSASGHPLAAMGPQVDYYSPEILDEYEVHAPGIDISGMSFPGASPYPLIGHGKGFAWTGTTALGDNADTFAEKLCTTDGSKPTTSSDHYLYKGRCVAFTHRDQVLQTPASPTDPTTRPEKVTLRTERSVHGPVFGFARVHGAPVALVRSTAVYGHGLRSVVAFELLAENKAATPQAFVADMHHFTGNENWFYVSSRHIGWLASGWFQRHAPGTDLEMPIWGTGQWDWKGFVPGTHNYTRQADPTKRAIAAHRKLTLAQVVGISGNASTQDLRGYVLPDLLSVLGPVTNATQRTLVTDLNRWRSTGAHRRDTRNSGYDDNSAAILVFDAWWRNVVHAVFDPVAGTAVMQLLQKDEDLVLDSRAVSSGFFDGWQSQLSGVLRKVRGVHDAANPRGTYCGNGTLSSCRAVLRKAFAAAVATVSKAQRTSNPAQWRKPVLCPGDKTPSCDENRPTTAGAVTTPSQPFENRGTFHQAVEITKD